MAKLIEFEHGDGTFSEWSEDESELVESAQSYLDDRGVRADTGELREQIRTVPSPRRIKSSAEAVMRDVRRRAGERAADEVDSGMTVGLGTGSTTAWAVAEIGRRLEAGEIADVRGVATSLQSHELAKEAGVPLIDLDEVTSLDVAIDGADQWDPEAPHVVKGGGASHAREKVIDTIADRLVIATDRGKTATPLDHPVPLSVLPESRTIAMEWVREQGGEPELRYAEAKDGPLFTANGNLVLDCAFGTLDEPVERAEALARIPGAQEHGLFVDMVDAVYAGTDGEVDVVEF